MRGLRLSVLMVVFVVTGLLFAVQPAEAQPINLDGDVSVQQLADWIADTDTPYARAISDKVSPRRTRWRAYSTRSFAGMASSATAV